MKIEDENDDEDEDEQTRVVFGQTLFPFRNSQAGRVHLDTVVTMGV